MSATRSEAFDAIRRWLDPHGAGLVRGAPDRFTARVGEVDVEVIQTAHLQDARWGHRQPLFGTITNLGSLTLRAPMEERRRASVRDAKPTVEPGAHRLRRGLSARGT